jgi:hypothetical protein
MPEIHTACPHSGPHGVVVLTCRSVPNRPREKAMKTFVLAAIAMVLIHSAEAHASTRHDLVKILVQIKVKSETGINICDLMAFQATRYGN